MEPLYKIVRKPIPVPRNAIRVTAKIVRADGSKVYEIVMTHHQGGRHVTEDDARNRTVEYAIEAGIEGGYFAEDDIPSLFVELPVKIERG